MGCVETAMNNTHGTDKLCDSMVSLVDFTKSPQFQTVQKTMHRGLGFVELFIDTTGNNCFYCPSQMTNVKLPTHYIALYN